MYFIKTTVIPLLKNKSGDISDVTNYHAIALSNCLNKLLEAVILDSFQSCDSYEDLQFGFKHGHSISLGCSVLKHVIDYYRSRGSYVFACFLDAFDSVSHRLLFDKLTKLNFPSILDMLPMYGYVNQKMNVAGKICR